MMSWTRFHLFGFNSGFSGSDDVEKGNVDKGNVEKGDIKNGDIGKSDVGKGDIDKGDVNKGSVNSGGIRELWVHLIISKSAFNFERPVNNSDKDILSSENDVDDSHS